MSRRQDAFEVPRPLAVAAAWSWRILLIAGATALTVLILLKVYVVVVPVVLALFLAAVLEPLAARLQRRGWHPALAAAIVFVGAVAVVAALLVWITASVAIQFADVGDQLDEAVRSAKKWGQGAPLRLSPERVAELDRDARDAIRSASGGLINQAADQARLAVEVLGGVVLLLFTLFFVLKDGAQMGQWLTERIPAAHRNDVVALTNRTRTVMRQYLLATAATGVIDGVLMGVALLVLGVPLVVPLAVLTVLGGFVPLLGATIAGLVCAVVALVANGPGTALLVVAATIIVQQFEGNVLQPVILERAVRLHPLVTVVAVAGGLIVGGLLGAFLSVPIVAIVSSVGSHYRTRQASPPSAEPDTVSLRQI